MSKIGIIFLIIAGIFFVLGILMYIVQKIITNKIYSDEQKSNNKSTKLSSIEDVDASLLDEIKNDEIEEF